ATGTGFIDGHTTAAASITFGTGGGTPTFGGFDGVPNLTVWLGGDVPASEGTLTLNVPSRLTMRTGNSAIRMRCRVDGAGSIVLSKLPGEENANFLFGESISPESTFSGGMRVDQNVQLQVLGSSSPSSGTSITKGPLGIGTCNMNGGTMFFSLGSFTIGNDINVTAESLIRSKGNDVTFHGDVRTNGNRLNLETFEDIDRALVFDNAGWSSADTGTLSLVEGALVEMKVNSGTSLLYGGYVGEGTSGFLNGTVRKFGGGNYEARHYRVGQLLVDEGTLRVRQEGSTIFDGGANNHVSRVNEIIIDGDTSPVATVDITNNEFIIDHFGVSPMGSIYNGGTYAPSGHIAQIIAGYAGGSWNGNGIISSSAIGTSVFGVGYAEASSILTFTGGTATFASQVIDDTTELWKFTYLGDTDLTGQVDLNDFTRLASAFGLTDKRWSDGDSNYDGKVDLDDFTALATNFGATTIARGTGGSVVSPLQELYVALLAYPQIYWEARYNADTWAMFEQFDSMNLGTIPEMPTALRASIPEPIGGALALLALAGSMKRRLPS
ncbi:MAG TPA: hypothetical protein PLD59_06870, partial [Tepidisphaeraceae bacterium]|nr:hypothetical protein [Tepidisphaeraceae bacterium]